jgi:hypothetical protein
MKPIYFPFTFISEPILKDISIFFPQTVIYQPSSGKIPEFLQQRADKGLLEIYAPFGGDEAKFERLFREYRDWIERHQGSDTTFFKTRLFDGGDLDTIPMYSETSTSQIKYHIKRGLAENIPQKPDSEFAARFFLMIAQEYDIQNDEFTKDLEHFQEMEHNLFSKIRGEDEIFEPSEKHFNIVPTNDLGRNKPGQRLSAWLKIFEKDPVAPDEFGSGLFLTTSHAILEHIKELFPEGELILSTGPVSTGNQTQEKIIEIQTILKENLKKISKNRVKKDLAPLPEMPFENNIYVRLNIFCFSKSPWKLFKETVHQPDAFHPSAINFQKTFIGIMEYIQQ